MPYEAFEEYMGSKGASWYEWDIWHNFEGNSSSDNSQSLWLLGYATRILILSKRNYHAVALIRQGVASPAPRGWPAKIAWIVNANTSDGTTLRNGYSTIIT